MSIDQSPKPSSLLGKSTKGATYLVLLQVGSRALTFLINQVLLRYLSLELLGISTQLELYSNSVLFFARESLRVALQRQGGDDWSSVPDQEKSTQSYVMGKRAQEVINVSYVAIGLGLPLAMVFASLYVRSADVAVLQTQSFETSLYLQMIATILELLSEPCFAVVQQQMLYSTRALAESLATLTRCLLTCGAAVWASRANRDPGAFPFAIGQLSYAIVLNVVYLASIYPISSRQSFSVLIKPIPRPSPPMLLSRFSASRLNLAANIYAQSIFKHILTTGDSLLIAALTSLESQGAYTLAANYGGLVARILFQPIEESSRSLFGRLLPQTRPSSRQSTTTTTSPPGSYDSTPLKQAIAYLRILLRFYTLLSILAITLGPTLSPLLLRLIAGTRWSNTEAPAVLSAYCYYIPLLAINGILEAFVSAVATPAQLRVQSAWMIAFSAAFAGTGVLVLRVWDQGAKGLVLANAVNMGCRILWSWDFVRNYLGVRGEGLRIRDVLPSLGTGLLGAGTAFVLRRVAVGFGGTTLEVAKGVAVVGVFGLGMCVLRRKQFKSNVDIFTDFSSKVNFSSSAIECCGPKTNPAMKK